MEFFFIFLFIIPLGVILFILFRPLLYGTDSENFGVEKPTEIINGQKFYRGKKSIPVSENNVGSMWNVDNISNKPNIIRKVFEHLSSAKKVYYEFFEIEDWDYYDSYVFYSDKLNSWCEFIHRNCNFSEFKVYKTGRRYDINYASNMHEYCPEFYRYLKPLYNKHKEEYLKDNNL